jgi:hypothetical protein
LRITTILLGSVTINRFRPFLGPDPLRIASRVPNATPHLKIDIFVICLRVQHATARHLSI